MEQFWNFLLFLEIASLEYRYYDLRVSGMPTALASSPSQARKPQLLTLPGVAIAIAFLSSFATAAAGVIYSIRRSK